MFFKSSYQSKDHTLLIEAKKDLDVFAAGALAEELDEENLPEGVKKIILNLEGVDQVESAPFAVLSVAEQNLSKKDIQLKLEGVAPHVIDIMKKLPMAALKDNQEDEEEDIAIKTGERMFELYATAAEFVGLMYDASVAAIEVVTKRKRPPKGSLVEQCIYVGVDALGIILLLSILIGLILGFQAAYQLKQFGASIYMADLVGISGVREFSPLMTAIIIAGRSGASIAAELGTMKVQEEIDALKSMGINPIRYLIVPRAGALLITLPSLTVISSYVVISGGMIIANLMLDIQITAYIEQSIKVIKFADWAFGFSKSFVFAWIIAIVGSFSGMSIRGGASEVGSATTKSVVVSIFLLIVIDSVFATISTLLKM